MEPAGEVNDELVLVETTTRLILKNITARCRIDLRGNEIGAVERSDSTIRHTRNESAGQRRIEWSCAQHVQRADVDVAGCERHIPRQLALDTKHALKRVRRLQSLSQ